METALLVVDFFAEDHRACERFGAGILLRCLNGLDCEGWWFVAALGSLGSGTWIGIIEGVTCVSCFVRTLSTVKIKCSFLKHRNYKIVYRRYASLFFLVGVDNDEITMKPIQEVHSITLQTKPADHNKPFPEAQAKVRKVEVKGVAAAGDVKADGQDPATVWRFAGEESAAIEEVIRWWMVKA
ncbi:hypothetical protein Droror1_Dr00012186 [Drosera rotundifolia]